MTRIVFWLLFILCLLINHSGQSANLGDDLNNSISNYFGGKDPNTQWKFFVGFGMVISNLNWAKDLNWSGYIRGYGDAFNDNGVDRSYGSSEITLITARHGVVCHHAGIGSYATNNPGWLIRAFGTDGNYYTNLVKQVSVFAPVNQNDLAVVTFSTNFPSVISPFKILPSTYTNYVVMSNIWMCWYRVNSNHIATTTSTTTWSSTTNLFRGGSSVPGSSFNDNVAIGGDSGGPFFFVLGTNLVFVGSLTTSNLRGPFVSGADNLALIQSVIGTNTLEFVDLSNYGRSNVVNATTLKVVNIHIGGSP